MARITTIRGDMDEELLEKRAGSEENENELREWIEYWFEGTLVHRSVHITLKKGVALNAGLASLG